MLRTPHVRAFQTNCTAVVFLSGQPAAHWQTCANNFVILLSSTVNCELLHLQGANEYNIYKSHTDNGLNIANVRQSEQMISRREL